MGGPKPLSLEDLVQLYHVVETPIAAWNLETGMVMRVDDRFRIVIAVTFEHTGPQTMVAVEIASGLMRFPGDSPLPVWHMDGEPFFVDVPPEELAAPVPGDGRSGSPPQAQDAAGIVPVWRGPKRLT